MRKLLIIFSFFCVLLVSQKVYSDCSLPQLNTAGILCCSESAGTPFVDAGWVDSGDFCSSVGGGDEVCCGQKYRASGGTTTSVFYSCSCSYFTPPPDCPFLFDPNNPPAGSPSGSPADPDNGGPPPDCDCTIERVCYNSSNQPVYYELDCCGTMFVYGCISLAVRCFRTDSPGSGPPVGPGSVPPLIQDPDSGWNMPPVYSGPPGGYDQPNAADTPDTDGDGIPDYADLEPNGLADGSDNPRWREVIYFSDGDGNKTGGLYEIEGKGGYFEWGNRVPEGGTDYVIAGPSWQSPESFADTSSGGGWSSSGGGGGAISYGTYDPFDIPVDPQNPTADEISGWEESDPPVPIDFSQVEEPRPAYETVSGSSGDSSAVIDADLREVSKLLSGIEQDQKSFGSASLKELEHIASLLENPYKSPDLASLDNAQMTNTVIYKDVQGQVVGWRLKVRQDKADGAGYNYNDYLVGQVSNNSEIVSNNGWFDSDLLFDGSHLNLDPTSIPHGWTDGSYGFGSTGGSGSGLTADDVAGALAGERAAGDADAEAERGVQTPNINGINPDFSGYVEADIPTYTDEQSSVQTKVDGLMTTGNLAGVRDSVGVSTSGAVSSLSCNVFGANIVFDFAQHSSILDIMGALILSLSYVCGFFLILRG